MKKKFEKFKKNATQDGIALLLTIIILSIVMLIAGLIITVVIMQLKFSIDANHSVIAVYTADSGVEWQLYQIRKGVLVNMPTMTNNAILSVTVIGSSPNFTIKSLGSYRTVKRQFEINL